MCDDVATVVVRLPEEGRPAPCMVIVSAQTDTSRRHMRTKKADQQHVQQLAGRMTEARWAGVDCQQAFQSLCSWLHQYLLQHQGLTQASLQAVA